MRALSVTLLCLCACSARETPQPQIRSRPAPVVAQDPAPVDEAAALEVVDLQLRTGRTRVGEAVRLHVSAWRASDGPGFDPNIELDGPATVERVGEEIIEEREGRVRERIDFRIEPTGTGLLGITVLAAPPLERPRAGELPILEVPRHELSLLISEALAPDELARQLSTRAGRLARGRALAQQGDYRRAIESYSLILEDQRDDPVVLGELGWAAFLAGDHSLARRATREGLRHQTDPKGRGALLYNLGRIAEALGRDDEAIAAYRRSLEVRPEAPTVRERLAKLEAGRPAPSCAGPSCPLTPPVDAIRACELIEEEGCPLVGQRGACRCDADGLAKLDAIGPWRVLTLTERDEAGINQVYLLLADAPAEGDSTPRYHVFAPLPGSHFHGDLRGGIRAAELVEVGELAILRVDFEGTVSPSSLAVADAEADRLARAWTLLCTTGEAGPVCAAPLLSKYQSPGLPDFVAPVVLSADGQLGQAVESGTAPASEELDLEFPGAAMQVRTSAAPVERAFVSARPD